MPPEDNSLEEKYEGSVYDSSLESNTPTPVVLSPVAQEPQPQESQFLDSHPLMHFNKLAFLISTVAVAVIVVIGGTAALLNNLHSKKSGQNNAQTNGYAVKRLSLQGIGSPGQLQVGRAEYLTVNGQLKVSNTLVLTPTVVPSSATAGQIYYDKTDNILYYFNSTKFVGLATSDSIANLGDVSRTNAGTGLGINGKSLVNTGVLTVQGHSGDVNFTAGEGIGINGLRFINTGVISLSGTANQIQASRSSGSIVLSLPQDIAPTSSPTFVSRANSQTGCSVTGL